MSKIEVDEIVPRSGNNLTVGSSGQTIIVPAGATFNASNSTFTLPDGTVTAAKIASSLDLSGKTVTLPASAVTAHVTPFDDNKIVNDISTLALRQASDQNKSAYSTGSSSVDVFQDDTGIDTTTDVSRNTSEYVSTIADNTPSTVKLLVQGNDASLTESITGTIPTLVGSAGQATSTKKFGTGSVGFPSGSAGDKVLYGNVTGADVANGQDFSMDCWVYHSNSYNTEAPIVDMGGAYLNNNNTFSIRVDENNIGRIRFFMPDASNNQYMMDTAGGATPHNQWFHLALCRISNSFSLYVNGNSQSISVGANTVASSAPITVSGGTGFSLGWLQQQNQSMNGYIDNFRWNVGSSLFTGNFTPDTNDINYVTVNATGNFTGTTITAPSSVSEMGAIITYQDNAGTNALNTDIVLQLSADGGSNYSTATLTALPDFSTGIKMAKVNDLAVTAGTQLKYKISFANQASGSKEARIRGVALQY